MIVVSLHTLALHVFAKLLYSHLTHTLFVASTFIFTALPGIGSPNWFYLTLLAPYAGLYYWRSGDRVDDIKVKLAESDDAMLNEVTIEGNDDELERMWRTLDLREKGMVKVEGLLETA